MPVGVVAAGGVGVGLAGQVGEGPGGVHGWPRIACRKTSIARWPCFTAVERYPRIRYRSLVRCSLVSRPEIFCWTLAGRRSRSAWLEVGGTFQIVGEAQEVGFAVAQDFQQQPGFALTGPTVSVGATKGFSIQLSVSSSSASIVEPLPPARNSAGQR